MQQDKKLTAQEIVRILGLQPLEREGGMFRQMWRGAPGPDGHPLGTAIYFLLSGMAFSHLHRLPTDEVYHFYLGDAVELFLLSPQGKVQVVSLGNNLAAGQLPQVTAPAGWWQGSRVTVSGGFALLGTTMAPGFLPQDYEHAQDTAALKALYPAAAAAIDTLTGETVYC